MRENYFGPICIGAVLLSVGISCSDGGDLATPDDERTTEEDVTESVAEAAETVGEYAADNKEAFTRMIEERLDDVAEGVETLQEQANESSDAARQELSETVDRLHQRRRTIQEDLAELRESSGDAWQKMRSGIERALAELEKAYAEARHELE